MIAVAASKHGLSDRRGHLALRGKRRSARVLALGINGSVECAQHTVQKAIHGCVANAAATRNGERRHRGLVGSKCAVVSLIVIGPAKSERVLAPQIAEVLIGLNEVLGAPERDA